MPAGATDEDISFVISYADVTEIEGLPDDVGSAGKLISIETDGSDSWDEYKVFNEWAIVTLPYEDGSTDGEPTMFYSLDEANEKLIAMGAFAQDAANKTLTFVTGTFSKFISLRIEMGVTELLGGTVDVDTEFRPASDGWYITNYGSYLEKGGLCWGMVSFARWYYNSIGTGMYSKYQNDTTEWRDDETAIELATRAHIAEDSRLDQAFDEVLSTDDVLNNQWTNPSSTLIGLSLVHALYTTKSPQLLGIFEQRADGKRYAGHAVMIYQYDGGIFYIYDPNNPGTTPDDANRQLDYTYLGGFDLPYRSGTSASAARTPYNVIMHLSLGAFGSNAAFQGLYDMAEKDFTDSTIFPEVEITSCKAWDTATSTVGADCDEETNDDGNHMYETDSDSVRLYGTILGGYSQGGPATDAADVRNNRIVSRTLVFIGDRGYWVPVDNELDSGTGKMYWAGSYSAAAEGVPLPLYQGENDLIVLATAKNSFSNWAGYKKDIIKSNASRADMTLTMTWGQGESDVDLHIQEPEVGGIDGRHIYYSNRGQTGSPSTTPYLDFDNTVGYGPEHYYASEGMSTYNTSATENPDGLYGTYEWRTHYYADHDDDTETTQPITWTTTYRYLKYEDTSKTPPREFWAEGSQSGALTSASSSGTSNFDRTGASWSSIYTIQYEEPDASEFVGDPPSVMLP